MAGCSRRGHRDVPPREPAERPGLEGEYTSGGGAGSGPIRRRGDTGPGPAARHSPTISASAIEHMAANTAGETSAAMRRVEPSPKTTFAPAGCWEYI